MRGEGRFQEIGRVLREVGMSACGSMFELGMAGMKVSTVGLLCREGLPPSILSEWAELVGVKSVSNLGGLSLTLLKKWCLKGAV